ncbi:MAG TPA: hypothetical protein VMW30_02480 [Candidatus Paceibacterota bacterium]|nr:hypothetical protein [Candidatus Paceibacterota bacterium]
MTIVWQKVVELLNTGGFIPAVILVGLLIFKDQVIKWSDFLREERRTRKTDKSNLIQNARFLASGYRKSDPAKNRVDFTDEQAYMAISSYLDERERLFIQHQDSANFRERLERLNNEVSRLARKWKVYI